MRLYATLFCAVFLVVVLSSCASDPNPPGSGEIVSSEDLASALESENEARLSVLEGSFLSAEGVVRSVRESSGGGSYDVLVRVEPSLPVVLELDASVAALLSEGDRVSFGGVVAGGGWVQFGLSSVHYVRLRSVELSG